MSAYDEVIECLQAKLIPVLAAHDLMFARSEIGGGLAGVFFEGRNVRMSFCENLLHLERYCMIAGSEAEMTLDAVRRGSAGWISIDSLCGAVAQRVNARRNHLRHDEFPDYSSEADVLAEALTESLGTVIDRFAAPRPEQWSWLA